MAWSKSLPTSCRTFLRLTAADRWTFISACLLLPVTALAFRGLGFGRWQATLQRWSPRPPAGSEGGTAASANGEARAYRTAWLVDVAARFAGGRDRCLAQSLILWWLLRFRGLTSELHIGVRKHRDQLQAHAWVEFRDRVLTDRGDGASPPGQPFLSFDRAVVLG
jgi:hypothetical protein